MAETEFNPSPAVRFLIAALGGVAALGAALTATGALAAEPRAFETPWRGGLAVGSMIGLAALEWGLRTAPAARRRMGWPVLAVAAAFVLIPALAPQLLVWGARPAFIDFSRLEPSSLLMPYEVRLPAATLIENARWATLLALWWAVAAGWLLVPRPAPPYQSDRFPALLLIGPPLVLIGWLSATWLLTVLLREAVATPLWILPALGTAALLPPLFGLRRGYKEVSHLRLPATTLAGIIGLLALAEIPSGWPLALPSLLWMSGALAFAGYLLFAGHRLALAERALGPVTLHPLGVQRVGQLVEVQLSFTPVQAVVLEALEICLYCHETTKSRSIDGKSESSHTRELHKLPASLTLNTAAPAGHPQALAVAVAIPYGAPATTRENRRSVSWTLDVALRVRGQVDWVGQLDVEVG